MLCEKRHITIHKLAMESVVSPSTLKNILYGKGVSHAIVTIKMLCDGFGIPLAEFFGTEKFSPTLEQAIK